MGVMYPELSKVPLVFSRGMVSNGDPTTTPRNAPSNLVNCVLTDKGYPSQCLGQQRYNPVSMGTAKTAGTTGFLATDGNNYLITASNGYLWWSSGNGTMTKVTYKNDGTAVTLDTTNYFYNFLPFPEAVYGMVVFCVTDKYPIVTNTPNGTHAQNCTTSRALMLYVVSDVVYAKNIFYDTSAATDVMYGASYGTWTAGTQSPTIASDTTVGHAATLSGGVMLTVAVGTAAGLNDMYKAETSFNGTDKTINVDLFPDTVANVDYIYLQLQDAGGHWSRWVVASSVLGAGALNNISFDLTSTPLVTSGTLDLTAVTRVTLGLHTTNFKALNYTFSQLVLSASGSDDQVVGHQSSLPPDQSWPEESQFICRVFDKILVCVGNNYYVSQSKDGLNWTNPTGAIDVGGGTISEDYTACLSFGTSVLLWTANTLTNLNATPGDLSTWREVPMDTEYGNVGNCVCQNNDGWVYYMSSQGIARTNGRIAELCDYDIQDQTSFLGQLNRGFFVSFLNQSTDWKNGSVVGTNNVDVSGTELKQTTWNTQAQWLTLNVQGEVETSLYPNAVAIGNGGALPTTNIALAGTASALQYQTDPSEPTTTLNNPASTALIQPGSLGYCWASFMRGGSGGPWWELDLGENYDIAGINFFINWFKLYGPGSQSPNPVMQYSLDNANWTTLGTIGATGAIHYIASSNMASSINARYLRILWPTLTEPDLYIVQLCGFSVFPGFPTGCTWSTPTIDYGAVPTTYGNLTVNINVPMGTTAIFSLIQSTDNFSTQGGPQMIGSIPGGTVGNYTLPISMATMTRYVRIECTMATDPTFTQTPILSFMSIGGQWVSGAVNLGITPTAWGVFSNIYDNVTVSYEISSSANGSSWGAWQTIVDGQIPTITLEPYLRYRVTLSGSNFQTMPDVQSISLAYFTGAASTNLPSVFCGDDKIYVAYMSNNSVLNANDSCFVGETHFQTPLDWQTSPVSGAPYPMWSKRDFIQASSFFKFNNKLMSAESAAGNVNYMEVSRTNCAFILDLFERPDSATTLGNTTTGQTWGYGDIGGAGDTDVFGIAGEEAYCVNANVSNHARYAKINSSTADCSVVCTLPVLNPNQGLILRWVDDNNYLAIWVGSSTVSPTQHEYYFRTVVSGVVTDSPSMPSAGSVGIANEGDQVQVKLQGTAVTVFINGDQLFQTTVANITGTWHGLYLAGTGYISSRWYYFSINYVNVPNVNYTSLIQTCAIFQEDVDLMIRHLYAYYACVSAFNIQYRTRMNQDNWSDWTGDLELIPSPQICRSQKLPITGIVNCMSVEFLITQPDSDGVWAVPKINVYIDPKPEGR